MRPHNLRAAAGNSGGIVKTNMRYYDWGDSNSWNSSGTHPNYMWALNPDGSIKDGTQNVNGQWWMNMSQTYTYSSSYGGYLELRQYPIGGTMYNPNMGRRSRLDYEMQNIGTDPFALEFIHSVYLPPSSVSTAPLDLWQEQSSFYTFTPSFVWHNYYVSLGYFKTNIGGIDRWVLGEYGLSGSGNATSGNLANYNYLALESTPQEFYQTYWNVWEHIVVTRENTGTNGMKFYRNGSLLGQKTNSIDYSFNPSGLSGGWSRQMYKLQADIGLHRVYNGTALTASDVATHYAIAKTRFTNLP